MEIGATSSTGYIPLQLAEPRVARNVPPESRVAVDKNREDERQRQALPSNTDKPAETGKSPDTQVARAARSERESQEAVKAGEAQRAQEVAVAGAGSIKMDVEDGDRVLKVFDSKEVLIYQLPPKGALMLIKAQEHAQQSQVQTSA